MTSIYKHQVGGTHFTQPMTAGTRDRLIFALTDIINTLIKG